MLLVFLVSLMFVYVNTLFYSLVLLFTVFLIVFLILSHALLHSLTGLMFLVVYLGAIMILIGYICAICPNMILTPYVYSLSGLLLPSFVAGLFAFDFNYSFASSITPMVTYFYSFSGCLTFFVLTFMLFITLLMVTSQYLVPKGPFRSVSN